MGIFLSGDKNLRKLSSHGHSDVGARQILDQLQMSFCNPLGYVLSISMCLQCYQNIPNCLRVIGVFFFGSFFANCPGSSRTVRGRTSVIIGHTLKVNLQLLCRSTFFGSCTANQLISSKTAVQP